MKKAFANAMAVVVLGPLWPFYGARLISDWSLTWDWPDYFLSKAEAILTWGDR